MESLIGIAVFAVYLLFHFCAVQVKCPGPDKRVEEVAFVFYTTYIKNKGQSDPSHRPLSADEITYYC